jgi:hypothetical protein
VRPGGLCLVIELALARVADPQARRYGAALKLGALREDVVYVPLLGRVWESLSLSHSTGPTLPGGFLPLLWPGPRLRARWRFARALAEYRAGRAASAFVQLGRAAHLLIDMACPVHARRVAHLDDPFEWYVDGNAPALAALPPARLPDAQRVEELVGGLAREAQRFEVDRTNHPLGRLLRKFGLRRAMRASEARAQAEALIPLAAAHLAALLELFLREARAG